MIRSSEELMRICKRVFLAGHSEGWWSGQRRRHAQLIEAEEDWASYVKRSSLDATLRSFATKDSADGQ